MIFAWLVIFGLIQATVFQGINFLVLFSIFAGFKKGPLVGLLIGGLTGIFAEILSLSVFGLNFVIFSMIGLLSGMIKNQMYYKENIFTEFLFAFFGILFFYLVYFVFNPSANLSLSGFSRAIQIALSSAIISPVLFRVIK